MIVPESKQGRQSERARGEVKKGWRGSRRRSSGEFLVWWCFRLNVTAGTQTLDWCCVETDVTPAHSSVSPRPSPSSLYSISVPLYTSTSLKWPSFFLFAGQHCTDIPYYSHYTVCEYRQQIYRKTGIRNVYFAYK